MIEDNEFIANLRQIELRLRPSQYSNRNGVHHLAHYGRSLEFSGYREYRLGDDPKDLDWKLFARSDRYYIKQRDAHTHANTLILLDDSRSMGFSSKSAKASKFRGGLLLAFGIGYVLHKQGDAFGFQTTSNPKPFLKPHSSKKAFRYFTQQLQKLDKNGPHGEINFFEQDPQALSLDHVFFISDFLVFPTQWQTWLKKLNRMAKEATCYQVIDPEEEDPQAQSEVRNIENTKNYRFMSANDWQEYRSNFQTHRKNLRQSCLENHIAYHDLQTKHPMGEAVRNVLSFPKKSPAALHKSLAEKS